MGIEYEKSSSTTVVSAHRRNLCICTTLLPIEAICYTECACTTHLKVICCSYNLYGNLASTTVKFLVISLQMLESLKIPFFRHA